MAVRDADARPCSRECCQLLRGGFPNLSLALLLLSGVSTRAAAQTYIEFFEHADDACHAIGQDVVACKGQSSGSSPQLLHISDYSPAKFCAREERRPPIWAWPLSQLRIRLQLEHFLAADDRKIVAPRARVTKDLRGFCQIGKSVLGYLPMLCEDCSSSACDEVATPIPMSDDWAIDLPPSGGCVEISRLPFGADRARAYWELSWDPYVILQVGIGLALIWNCKPFAESVFVHASFGAIASIVVMSMVVMWWVSRHVRGTVRDSVPFGRTLSGLAMFTCAVLPWFRELFTSFMGRFLPRSPREWYDFISARDPFFGFPLNAALVVTMLALAVPCAHYSVKYFAPAIDPEGEIRFEIGSDGRRIDVLPSEPLPRRCLAWVLWSLGLSLALAGTHSDGWSMLLVVIALLYDHIVYYVQSVHMSPTWTPGALHAGQLTSWELAQQMSQRQTERAMVALKRYVQVHPGVYSCARDSDSELRWRRFAENGRHFQRPPADVADEEHSRCRCSIL